MAWFKRERSPFSSTDEFLVFFKFFVRFIFWETDSPDPYPPDTGTR